MVSRQPRGRDRACPSPDKAAPDNKEPPAPHQRETTLERSPSPFSSRSNVTPQIFFSLHPPFVAIELRNWLLFFAPVILEGFLPSQYYQNLVILVEVLHVLLSRKIPLKVLDSAEHNLKVFLKAFEQLYGDLPSFVLLLFVVFILVFPVKPFDMRRSISTFYSTSLPVCASTAPCGLCPAFHLRLPTASWSGASPAQTAA